MATTDWPGYARLSAAEERGWANDVARTEFDDGAVQQRRLYSSGIVRRDVVVQIPADRAEQFEAWLYARAHLPFLVPDPIHGHIRGGRIVGGVGGCRWRQTRRSPGPAWWEVEMTIESPIQPPAPRDLWDASLPLGDTSHVYWRVTVAPDFYAPSGKSVGAWPADASEEGRIQVVPVAPDFAPQLPAFLIGGPPPGTTAYVSRLILYRLAGSYRSYQLRLSPTQGGRGTEAGPQFYVAPLPDLAICMRFSGTTAPRMWTIHGIGGADTTEPYQWSAGAVRQEQMNAFLEPGWLASVTQISAALVWAGADSVIDLDAYVSVPVGRRPVWL